MVKVMENVPEADCVEWLEQFLKARGAIRPKEVYAAGIEANFTQNGIKAARRYLSGFIESRSNGTETFWRWKHQGW